MKRSRSGLQLGSQAVATTVSATCRLSPPDTDITWRCVLRPRMCRVSDAGPSPRGGTYGAGVGKAYRGSCGSCVAATRISTTYFAERRQWRRCPRLRSGESRAGSAMTIALTWWLSEAMVFFSAGNQALLCTVNHRPCGLLGSAVPRPSQGLRVRSEKLDLAQSIGDAFRLPEQLSHSLARSREASWDSPAGGALKKSVAERSPDNSRPVVS